MKPQQKYVWSAREFDEWVRNQQKKIRERGFKISTSDVTKKLVNEILLPHEIDLSSQFPRMVLRKKNGKQKR